MAEITTPRARKTRGKQIRRGISWNAANLLVSKGMAILVRILLARLLVPEYFGLIAMVVVFLGLVQVFVDFGLKNALIQRSRDANSLIRYDSAFWFLLLGGIGWTSLFVMAGIPLMTWFYNEQQLTNLALVMSVSILMHSLSILPEVRLTRRMRFKSIVIAEVVSTIIASLVAIVLAYGGAGAWALATQQIVSVGIRTAMLWLSAQWRPRRRYSLQSLRDVVGFSGWMLANQLLHYLRQNLDKMLVGALLGAASLGIYTLAYMLTEVVRVLISGAVSKVVFPAYSRSQNDLAEVKRLYLRVIRYTTLAVFPISTLMILFADSLVSLLFGEQWVEVVVPAKILAFGSMIYAASGEPATVLRALGKPKISLIIKLLNTVLVVVPAFYLGAVYWGMQGIAWAVVLSFIVNRIMFQIYFRKTSFVTEAELLSASFPAIAFSTGILTLFSLGKSIVF